jgi:hypothetical protein
MRTYYISKLDEQKALKIIHAQDKESVEFRDYIENLKGIDWARIIKLLNSIGTQKAKRLAVWMEEMMQFPEYIDTQLDYVPPDGYPHPALKKIIYNSSAYVDRYRVYLKYKDVIVADIPHSNIAFSHIPEMMEFKNAINWLLQNVDKMNYNTDLNGMTFKEKNTYSSNVYVYLNLAFLKEEFAGIRDYLKGAHKETNVSPIIKEIDYKKVASIIESLPNEKIYINIAEQNTLEMLKKIANEINISNIKNIPLRMLFRLIKRTNKPLVALVILHYLNPNFETRCLHDETTLEEYEEAKAMLDRIFKNRKIKEIKKIIRDGYNLINGVIKINYDGTPQILNLRGVSRYVIYPKIYY